MKTSDYCETVKILKRNDINFRQTAIYDEQNNEHLAIWLDTGHFEFDLNGNLTKVVPW